MPLLVPSCLREGLRRPVAVLGGGLSGRATAELLARLGASSVIYDERGGAGERRSFGAAEAAGHGLAVFSPGFRVDHPWLVSAAAAGCLCLAELDLAALLWRGKVVAITGTNGKTTLTEFLTHAFNRAGLMAFACGNIGMPFTRLVSERDCGAWEEIAVCEVSSFQAEMLWHLEPAGVLWTNLAEDHLERHPGMRAYGSAKLNLLTLCRGPVLVGSSVVTEAARAGLSLGSARSVVTVGVGPVAGLENTVFADYPQRENFLLASSIWETWGLPPESLFDAARSFRLGRHRLAPFARVGGVCWWNDSKATNFHAVEAALSRFTKPVLLIAGGRAKGGDLPGFIARIAPSVKHLLLIGETTEILAAAALKQGVAHSRCESLEGAVRRGSELAVEGDQVLLSPGFASFDMFRGYDHRGEAFELCVKNLGAAVAAGETRS